MTDESHDNQGELPEQCPECGADKQEYVTPNATPVPTLTLTVSPP